MILVAQQFFAVSVSNAVLDIEKNILHWTDTKQES